MDDTTLLELLKTNPNVGMEQLINQYSALIYTVIKNKICDVCISSEVEECVADVFSEFYIGLSNYNSEKSSIKAYLCAIANHKSVDIYKSRRKQIDNVSLDDDETRFQLGDGENVEKDLLENEQRRNILKAVKSLGEPDSSIVFLKFYFGESSKEIGRRLGLSVSNVDTRTHRALKKLKEMLGV